MGNSLLNESLVLGILGRSYRDTEIEVTRCLVFHVD